MRDATYPGTIVRRRTPTPSRWRLKSGRASDDDPATVRSDEPEAARDRMSGQKPDTAPGHPGGVLVQPIERSRPSAPQAVHVAMLALWRPEFEPGMAGSRANLIPEQNFQQHQSLPRRWPEGGLVRLWPDRSLSSHRGRIVPSRCR